MGASCYPLFALKMAVCVVHHRDKGRVTEALLRAGFKFTTIGSSGGFLREGSVTLLIGVTEEELPSLRAVVAENCQRREQMVSVGGFEGTATATFAPNAVKVQVGGAVMFVLDVDSFERF